MLDEARRRRERGQDVVVGGVQPRVPPDVEEVLRKLEVIPLKAAGTAIDVDAILRRRPAVCVIDGIAYDNRPGSRHPKRWQDIEELLHSGIKVIGSVNVQYIAEFQDDVEAITGKRAAQTVPVAFIRSADEIEIVDAPAGNPIELPDDPYADAARQNRLSRLRELALVLAADVVEEQLTTYLERHGIHQHLGAQERIMVCATPRANMREMLETARVIADRFHGELIVAYVNQPGIAAADRAALEDKLAMARAARAAIEILEGEDPVETLIDFAKSRGVTQLFIGHTQRSGIRSRLLANPVDKLIRRSEGMDVRIFPQ
jgi:two-component system sensor histidine kinase KdpD